MRKNLTLELNAADRKRLERLVADRNTPAKMLWRADVGQVQQGFDFSRLPEPKNCDFASPNRERKVVLVIKVSRISAAESPSENHRRSFVASAASLACYGETAVYEIDALADGTVANRRCVAADLL